DLNPGVPWADQRIDDALDLLAQPVFQRDLPFVDDRAAGGVVIGAIGQETAGFVDDGDALRTQAVDGGGDEMADGAHLPRLERAADPQDDGGGRLDLVARKQRAFRNHQVNARVLNAVERADGAFELAFERAHRVDVLHEARGAERIRLVEDLVADAAALRQPALGKLHSQLGDTILRHQNLVAVVAQLIRNSFAIELFYDPGGVVERQVGEQRHHLRRSHAQDKECEEADQRQRDRPHGGNARGADGLGELQQILHQASPQATLCARQDLPGGWLAPG